MINNFIKVLLILFLNSGQLICLENKIITKIDNQIITAYELKNKILSSLVLAGEEINQENINKTKPLALQTLTSLKLKSNELVKYNVNVSDLDLNNNLNSISKNNLQNFKNKFLENNLNFELYREDLRIELGWRKLIFNLYNNKVIINEIDIDNQILKIKKEKNQQFTEYRLSEILVNYNTENEKNNKINEIKKQIIKIGFENTAFKYSESFTATNKGDLGWVNSNGLSKDIAQIIKDMKINDISKPINNLNNILFLKLTNKKIVEIKNEDISEIRKKLIDNKKNELFNLYSNSHLSKLKNNATIEYK
jgi:peptidyl-prolyl cis-trans isomerase SurA